MREFLKKRREHFYEIINESSVSHVWWILLFFLATFLCFTHIYNDILVTAKASYNFWDYFFSGNIRDYFSMPPFTPGEYYIVEGRGKYPVISKIVMSIWMLPVWTIGKIIGHSIYNTVGSLIWLKMWLFLSCFLSGSKVYDIVKKFRDKTCAANTAFIFYSCIIIFLNTFIVSQIEIFTCLMILYGIEGWIEDNNNRFLFFFMVAVGMKYFALLAFFPLLLIKCKKTHMILVNTCVASISVLEVCFPKVGGGNNAPVMLPMFIYKIFDIGHSSFYPFIFTIALVLIFAYLHESKTAEKDFIYAIFSEVILWGAFCFFAKPHPYWSVLMVPFISLGMGMSIYKKKELIMTEMLLTGLLSFIYFCRFYWVYDARTELEMGVIPWLFRLRIELSGEELGYHSTLDLLSKFKLGSEPTVALSYNIALACMVVFIYILWENYKNDNMQIENEKSTPYVFRFLINAVVGLLPVIAFLYFYL